MTILKLNRKLIKENLSNLLMKKTGLQLQSCLEISTPAGSGLKTGKQHDHQQSV